MNVTFKAENGHCPYFEYKDKRFYIKDSKNYKKEWVYSLYFKKIDKLAWIEFGTQKQALEHAEKRAKFVCESDGKRLYSNTLKEYIVDGNKVSRRYADTPLSGEFDSYNQCLEFAKEYIQNYITEHEPQQIEITELGRLTKCNF